MGYKNMNDEAKVELWVWVGGMLIVAGIFLALLPQWLRGDEAKAALTTAGYTEIQLGGFLFLDCGDDLFGLGFTAKGPTGVPAAGAVCKGIFKGATIRLEATKIPASAVPPGGT